MARIVVEDNSDEVLSALRKAKERALEMIGLKAERYAKEKCPVDTGNLRNSITHIVKDDVAYIGTNVEYAPYVELGTGLYATNGGGRQTPWAYQDSKGNWHRTVGQKPQPFLKPAATEHSEEYRTILKDELQNH